MHEMVYPREDFSSDEEGPDRDVQEGLNGVNR